MLLVAYTFLVIASILKISSSQVNESQALANYKEWLSIKTKLPRSYLLYPLNRAFGTNDAAHWVRTPSTISKTESGCSNNLWTNGPYGSEMGALRPYVILNQPCVHEITIGEPIWNTSIWTITFWAKRTSFVNNAAFNLLSFKGITGAAYYPIDVDIFNSELRFKNFYDNNAIYLANCNTDGTSWFFVVVAYDTANGWCSVSCDGTTAQASFQITETRTHKSDTLRLVIDPWSLIYRDVLISCLQMFNGHVDYTLARRQCELFDTLFDGVTPGSCHVDTSTPTGWSCDGCYHNSTSPICKRNLASCSVIEPINDQVQAFETLKSSLPSPIFLFPLTRAFGFEDAAVGRSAANSLETNGSNCEISKTEGPKLTWRSSLRTNLNKESCPTFVNVGETITTTSTGWTIATFLTTPVDFISYALRFHVPSNNNTPSLKPYYTTGLWWQYYANTNADEFNVACNVVNKWTFVAMIYDKPNGVCKLYCQGVFSSNVTCSESTMHVSQKLSLGPIESPWGTGDNLFHCLQMYRGALTLSQLQNAEQLCQYYETLYDGVVDGSCHIDSNAVGGISCSSTAPPPISDACLVIYPTTSTTTTTTAATTTTKPGPIAVEDHLCSNPSCNPRTSICTSTGACKCLARFKGGNCADIEGQTLSDQRSYIPMFTYLNDGDYQTNWLLVRSGSDNLVQPNKAIRLTQADGNDEYGFLISKTAFPFTDFTLNATFEFGFANESFAEGLRIAVVSNQSIKWDSTDWAFDTSSFAGLAVGLMADSDTTEVYISKSATLFGSSDPNYNSTPGIQLQLRKRFHVGLVVRQGQRITLEFCTVSACSRLISSYMPSDSLPITPTLDPPVLAISANTGTNGQAIDLIDFRGYSLTPPNHCRCKPLRGWCYARNKCVCKPGWTGPLCANQICGSKQCSRNSYCTNFASSTCTCFDKWKQGDNCDEPFCDCEVAKRCILPQKCKCIDGTRRIDCSEVKVKEEF